MIVTMVGNQGAGKSTLANSVTELSDDWRWVSFADNLKQEVATIIAMEQIPDEMIETACGDEEVRELIRILRGLIKMGFPYYRVFYSVKPPKLRRALQLYGTEYRRRYFGEDYWRVRLLEDIRQPSISKNFIIDDMRFPDEYECLNTGEFGKCIVMGIENPNAPPGINSHASESHRDYFRGVSLLTLHNRYDRDISPLARIVISVANTLNNDDKETKTHAR